MLYYIIIFFLQRNINIIIIIYVLIDVVRQTSSAEIHELLGSFLLFKWNDIDSFGHSPISYIYLQM